MSALLINGQKIIVPDWITGNPYSGLTKNYGTTPNGLYKKLQELKIANGPEAVNINIGSFNALASQGECP